MTTQSCKVAVVGPLTGYAAGFDVALKAYGYRENPRIGRWRPIFGGKGMTDAGSW